MRERGDCAGFLKCPTDFACPKRQQEGHAERVSAEDVATYRRCANRHYPIMIPMEEKYPRDDNPFVREVHATLRGRERGHQSKPASAPASPPLCLSLTSPS